MKLEIKKELLSLAVNRVQGAISDRTLAQIGLNAKAGQLQMAATDRILAVYSKLDCNVSQEGIVFVPGKLFSDVIKELPEGSVQIEREKSYLIIVAGKNSEFRMKIPVIEDAIWKEAPNFDSKNKADVATAKLSYMIEQVQLCIQNESPRNYGAVGFLHKPEKGKLRLVGTDGFRLSYCDITIDLPDNFLVNGICVSKRALIELHRMCNEGFETLNFIVSEDLTTLVANSENYKLYIRLSAVKYPKYQGVLPTAYLNPVKLSKPLLQSVTKRVLLAADKTNALQLSFSDSSLTLSSKTVGSSESQESLELSDFKGSKTALFVNGKYLNEVFSTVACPEITLQFKSEEDPVVIIPKDEPLNCRSMHVLVPIRENI